MDAIAAQPSTRRVAVVGAGLSGLAAAISLVDLGYSVTVLEQRSFGGGRACSFLDRENGLYVDNGQHLFMRCCRRYIAFLNRIGALSQARLQSSLSVRVAGDGKWASVRSVGPVAPLHLLPSLMGYTHLSLLDRVRLPWGAMAALAASRKEATGALDSLSFHDWLVTHGQSPRAIDRFWNLICLATLNSGAESVSAEQALMVLRVGFLGSAHAADLGFHRVDLGLVAAKAIGYLRGKGVSVLLGRRVERLRGIDRRVVSAELGDGSGIEADYFVVAVPPDRLLKLLPRVWARDPFFRPAATLSFSPIANVHLWYDQPMMEEEIVASLGTLTQWVFNKGALLEMPAMAGRYLLVTIGDARRCGDVASDLPRAVSQEIADLFPAARSAQLKRARVFLEPRATFVPAPGSAASRLTATTPLENLWLAGDWTQTGWPATMEGAVRSGERAAALLGCPSGRARVAS